MFICLDLFGFYGITTLWVCYIARYTDVWNKHRESEKTKLVQVRNFISFELKVIWHEERERERERERDTQSFYADCFYIVGSQPNQRAAPVVHKFVWPHPVLNLDSLVQRQELNSLLFLKSTNPQPTLPVRDVTHISWFHSLLGFLFWHLWMTHSLRVRVNTCVNVAPN